MQGIADPDLYQLSEVVQKSSKSGIFSNRRLLMIKDGFLYYYSKVPSDYKGHQTNVMNQLKEYPKSSIQIRMLKDVQAQSPKSSTLIIYFNSKDMIDRQDIRKSVQSKSFVHPVKTNASEEQEWRFTFPSFMRCRVWYASLHKLMDHFKKNNDGFNKFTEYMANFDNELRKSLPRVSPSSKNNRISAPNTRPFDVQPLNNERLSTNIQPDKINLHKDGIFAIPEAAEQYDDNQSHQSYNNKNTAANKKEEKFNERNEKKVNLFNQQTRIQDIIKVQSLPETKQPQKVEKQKILTKQSQSIKEISQLTKKSSDKQQINRDISETNQKEESKQSTAQSWQLQHQKQLQQQNRIKMQELAESVRREERKKAEIEADLLQLTIKKKEQQIDRMREEIEANKISQQALEERVREQSLKRAEEQQYREMLERQKKEEEQYRKIQDSLAAQIIITPPPPPPTKQLILVEYSIQTDIQKEKQEFVSQKQIPTSTNKKSVLSYPGQSVWSPTFGGNSNRTMSYLGQINIQTRQFIDDYDYFWEMSQIYKQQHTSARLGKQLTYASFLTKASKEATTIIRNYIDQNKPTHSVKIDRHIFDIEIVCDKGSIIKTEAGQNRLIYNNQNHQRLKRTFKIYNRIHDMIICIVKKKPNFTLRVPFCCLVQYKGYTALAQILPAKQYPSKELTLLKVLGSNIPSYNLKLTDFDSGGQNYSLATINILFKPSKEDQVSLMRGKYCDFLQLNRQNHVSIQAKKLFQQVNEIENNKERYMIAETLAFCRELKKIMKSTAPFVDPHKQLAFFEQLLANQNKFIRDNCVNRCSKTGFTLFYIQKILGIKTPNKWGESQINYKAMPVVRSFSLKSLDASLFANKFQKFCLQKKFQLAEQALKFSKQLDQNYNHIVLKEVQLLMHQQKYYEALQKMELSSQLFHTHCPQRLMLLQLKAQCFEAIGQNEEVLTYYRELLEQTEYMYGNQGKLAEIYFLIAGTLARQGRNKQLVEVYREILKQYPSYRNRVIIQFCETLLAQQADPHIILDFIQKETSEQTQKYSLDIQMLLGDLYQRCRNLPKALICYQQAFEILETTNTAHITNLFLKLIDCTTAHSQRKNIHRQLVAKFSHNSFTKEQIQMINTKVAELIFWSLNNSDRHVFGCLLHDAHLSQQLSSHSSLKLEKITDWSAIEQCIHNISNRMVSINQLCKYLNLQRLFQACSRSNTL